MRKLYCAMCAVLCLLASGCSTIPSVDKMDPAYVAAKATLTRDDFKKYTYLKSVVVFYNKYADPLAYEKYYLLASRKDGSSKVNYFLVIDTMRKTDASWAFWKEIYDKSGNKFPFADSDRKAVNDPLAGVGVREVCHAPVTREYLESLQDGVNSFKVYGEGATSTFETYPNWVQGFLQRVDKEFPATAGAGL